MSKFKALASIALFIAIGAAVSACAPEEYGVCTIPSTPKTRAACVATETQSATCLIEYVFDCDSMLCGIYNDEGPYCTRQCVPSADACKKAGYDDCSCPPGKTCVDSCPDGGACIEWTKGTSAFYCVKPADKSTAN